MTTDFLLVGLGLAGQWGLGAVIALAILGPRLLAIPIRGTGFVVARAELVGLGFVLGIAATSELLFVWSWSGGKQGRECSLVFAIVGIVLGLITLWIGRKRVAEVDAKNGRVPPSEVTRSLLGTQLARLCGVLIFLIFVSTMIQALLSPQKFWDERAYYGLKAKVLFEDRTIFSPDLLEPDFVQGHPRYPLLIALAEQHLYALLGRVDDRLSKIIFPVFFFGLVFTLAGILMRHMSMGRAWLGALLLATIPVLVPDDYGFACGQADAPMACMAGITLIYLWDCLAKPRFIATGSRSLMMAAMFIGFTAFTKDEGIAYGVIHSASFIFALSVSVCFGGRTRTTLMPLDETSARWTWKVVGGSVLILSIIPWLPLALWFEHRRHLPLTGEMNYFGRLSLQSLWNGLPTLNWSVPHLAWRMFGEATIWGLQWWFVALTLVLFPKRTLRPAQLFLLLALLGDLAALLLAGMIAPVMLEEHIGGSSHRYLMQLAPGALLFAIGQIQDDDA